MNMKKIYELLLLLPLVSLHVTAQSADGFVSLFDGKSLGGWMVSEDQYAKNFSVKDGFLHIEGSGGWLKSARQYSDFILKIEVRFVGDTPVANSGVFVRTPAQETFGKGWPSNSYQVRLTGRQGIRPASPGDGRWSGAFLRFGAPEGPTVFNTDVAFAAYKKTGEWQTFETQVLGQTVTVTVNDRLVGRSYSVTTPVGFIGFQCESGAIDVRSVQIKDMR